MSGYLDGRNGRLSKTTDFGDLVNLCRLWEI